MKAPIIVVEQHTCFDIFQSVEAAENYVEAPDISLMTVYDADGNLLTLTPISPIHVLLEEPNPAIDKSDDLRKDITNYLVKYHNHSVDTLSSAPLGKLIDLLVVIHQK